MVKYEGQSYVVEDNVKDWKVNVKQMTMFAGGAICHDLLHDKCQSLSLIYFYYPPPPNYTGTIMKIITKRQAMAGAWQQQ